MDFDSENNSIFEGLGNSGMPMPQNIPMPQEINSQQSLLGTFLNSIKNKLDETKRYKEEKNLQEELQNFVDQNEETILILKSFGCKLTFLSLNAIEISSEEFNIKGHIYTKDDTVEIDEECKKLFAIISTIISGGYRIEDTLNKYEQEEFYPYGEIEQIPVTYKGTEIKASKGTLMNPKGETRTIIFYRGYEITPDDETKEN